MLLKKSLSILLISVCLPYNALGADKAVFLERDARTPYAGVLMPEEALQSLRKEVLDAEYDKASYEKSLTLYRQSEELLNKKTTVLMEQNNKLAEQLYSTQSLSTLERIGWFSLGVMLSGVVSYGIYKAGISAR